MAYFIYPTGTVSHTVSLEARSTAYTSYPYMPTGLQIQWRVNGAVVKTGDTTNDADRKLNTGTLGDFKLKPWHNGLLVDFVIGGSTFSSASAVTNQDPTLSGGIEQDEYSVSPSEPSIYWSYDDADGDRQYLYRVMLGSFVGGTDYYDSGYIYGDPGDANGDGVVDENDYNYVSSRLGANYGDSNYSLSADFNRDGTIDQSDLDIVTLFMGTEYTLTQASETYTIKLPEITAGVPVFWSIQAGDGDKIDNTNADWPEPPRKFLEIIGESTINHPPVVNTVLIDGV